MRKNLVFTFMMAFMVSIFSTAFAAEAITVKGSGSIDKNYISCFAGQKPFSDGASVIKPVVDSKGALTINYELQKGGWLGATCEQFQEDWSNFTGIQFNIAGGTGNKIRLELTDGNGVSYEFVFVDDSAKGKLVTVPFNDFKVRTDYQPAGADTDNPFSLTPVRTLNISPLSGKGTLIFSNMKLYK